MLFRPQLEDPRGDQRVNIQNLVKITALAWTMTPRTWRPSAKEQAPSAQAQQRRFSFRLTSVEVSNRTDSNSQTTNNDEIQPFLVLR